MKTLWTANKNGIVKVSEKGFNLSKTGQIIEAFLACRNGRIEVGELLEVACKPSFEKYGKVNLISLPNWKDIKTYCLNSMYTAYTCGGTFWDLQFSQSGKTAYFVQRNANKLPVKFEVKEEKVVEEAVAEEVPATSDADLLRALAHQVQNADLASILERLASIGVEGWKSETTKEVAIA